MRATMTSAFAYDIISLWPDPAKSPNLSYIDTALVHPTIWYPLMSASMQMGGIDYLSPPTILLFCHLRRVHNHLIEGESVAILHVLDLI